MSQRKNIITGITASIGMLLLILDSRTVLSGAREGIELCLSTVVPSLFPFFVISMLLTGSLTGHPLRMLRPLGKFCGMDAGSESLLAVGLLAGYPVGAQNVNNARNSGQITQDSAERLLGFCSNAGPAFLFGMVGAKFDIGWIPWLLWMIHMISAFLSARVLRQTMNSSVVLTPLKPPTFPQAVERSIKVMASVCGWVTVFRVLTALMEKWFIDQASPLLRVLIFGVLELANGCCMLHCIENSGLRFVLCSGILAFGGLCVTMQTISVTSGLKLKFYYLGKLFQTLFSLLLSYWAQNLLFPQEKRFILSPTISLFIILLIILLKFTVAFPKNMLYNQAMQKKKRCIPCYSEKTFPEPVNTAPEAQNLMTNTSYASKKAW